MQANKEETEALDRLKACQAQKEIFNLDLKECYYFAAPHRLRTMSTKSRTSATKPDDAAERQISIAEDVAQDFATEFMNDFMPEEEQWAARGQGLTMDDDSWAEIKDDVEATDPAIFRAIKASNFYPAIATGFNPDLAIGTTAMWIKPVTNVAMGVATCLPVPINELDINVGPEGTIDDRFVYRLTKVRHLDYLLGDQVDKEAVKKATGSKKPEDDVTVRWGFWREWDHLADEKWNFAVLVDNKLVHSGAYLGEGSCPLVVGALNRDPAFAWGIGPMIQALPLLRVLDELSEYALVHAEFTANKPFGYPDDGIFNFENGIESGMGYPMRPGSGNDIVPLHFDGSIDSGIFQIDQLERQIRRLHFLDRPEQRGDTPPSATQWYDETIRAQRRLGGPGKVFWRSYPYEVFKRFNYLLEKSGIIEPVKLKGASVSLQPINPAHKAVDAQEVEKAVRVLEITGGAFPQEMQMRVNAGKTIENIKERIGDKLVELNSDAQIKDTANRLAVAAGNAGVSLDENGQPVQQQPQQGGQQEQ